MEFEWDENKRESNFEKHGIDFLDVLELFEQQPHIKKSPYEYEEKYLQKPLKEGK